MSPNSTSLLIPIQSEQLPAFLLGLGNSYTLMCSTAVKQPVSIHTMSKPLKLCCRILIVIPLADNMPTATVHPDVGLPSQPWPLFLLLLGFFSWRCVSVYWWWWRCLLGFVGVFWFALLEADAVVSKTVIQSWLHVLGIGKARKVRLWAIKQKRG